MTDNIYGPIFEPQPEPEMAMNPRVDDVNGEKEKIRAHSRKRLEQVHNNPSELATYLQEITAEVENNRTMTQGRIEQRLQDSRYREVFGETDNTIAQAELIGIEAPKDAAAYNDFSTKILNTDEVGNFKIQDERTIGWADASAATYFLTNYDVSRGITARGAGNMLITQNLIKGGFRGYFEDRGVANLSNSPDLDVNIRGSGFAVNPANWASVTDFFGILEKDDLAALQYKDPNWNTDEYLKSLVEVRPDFMNILFNSGVDKKDLQDAPNVDAFWFKVNGHFALRGAAESLGTWKNKVGGFQEFALLAKDFIRDSLINDPDFAGELVLSGIIGSMTSGVGGALSAGAIVGRRINKTREAARKIVRMLDKVNEVRSRTMQFMPQNWGLAAGYALRNTKVGRFFDVQARDVMYRGKKFDTALKYGNKFAGYTFAELPAGFIEEGMAGALNQMELNRSRMEDRSVGKAFLQEGIAGSAIRAFGINPALRGINAGLNYTKHAAGSGLTNFTRDILGQRLFDRGAAYADNFAGFFGALKDLTGWRDTGYFNAKADLFELQDYLADPNNQVIIDGKKVTKEDAKDIDTLIERHPAFGVVAVLGQHDPEAMFGSHTVEVRDPVTGKTKEVERLKIISLFEDSKERALRVKAGLSADADIFVTDDMNDVEKEVTLKNLKAYEAAKKQGLTKAELNRAMIHVMRASMTAEAVSSADARTRLANAYFNIVVEEEARAEMAKTSQEAQEGEKRVKAAKTREALETERVKLNEQLRAEGQAEIPDGLTDSELRNNLNRVYGNRGNLSYDVAVQRVLESDGLLSLLDSGLVANELNAMFASQNPEMFDVAEKDGRKIYTPKKEFEKEVKALHIEADFDTKRLAVIRARKVAGVISDPRTMLTEILQIGLRRVASQIQTEIKNTEGNVSKLKELIKDLESRGIPVTIDGDLEASSVIRLTLQIEDIAVTIVIKNKDDTVPSEPATTPAADPPAPEDAGVDPVDISEATEPPAPVSEGITFDPADARRSGVDQETNDLMNKFLQEATDPSLPSGSVARSQDRLARLKKIKEGRTTTEAEANALDSLIKEEEARLEKRQAEQGEVDPVAEFNDRVDNATSHAELKSLADELNPQLEAAEMSKVKKNLSTVNLRNALKKAYADLQARPTLFEPTPEPTPTATTNVTIDARTTAHNEAIVDLLTALETVDGKQDLGQILQELLNDVDQGEGLEVDEATKNRLIEVRKAKREILDELYDETAKNRLENKRLNNRNTQRTELENEIEELQDPDEGEVDQSKLDEARKRLKGINEAIQKLELEINAEAVMAAREKLQKLEQSLDDLAPEVEEGTLLPAPGTFALIEYRKMRREKVQTTKARIRKALKKLLEANATDSNANPLTVESIVALTVAGGHGGNVNTKAKLQKLALQITQGAFKDEYNIDARSTPLTNVDENTKLSQKELEAFVAEIESRLDDTVVAPLTESEENYVRRLAALGVKRLEELLALENGEAMIARAMDQNTEPIASLQRNTGKIVRVFSDAYSIDVTLSEEEKSIALNRARQLKLIKALRRGISNLGDFRGDNQVTEFELANMARVVHPVFTKMNFWQLFSEAVVTDSITPSAGSVRFDIDELLIKLDDYDAKLQYMVYGKKTEEEKQAILRDIATADPDDASTEYLLDTALELANGDAEALRVMGQDLFNNGPDDLKGYYILSQSSKLGKIKKSKMGQEYESHVRAAIRDRLKTLTPSQRNRVSEFLMEQMPGRFNNNKYPNDRIELDLLEAALLDYLSTYNRDIDDFGDVSEWGNGTISYTPADQLGAGIVDLASGARDGTTRHRRSDLPVDPTKATGDKTYPSEYQGRVSRRNNHTPLGAGRLQQQQEDYQLKRIAQFIAGIDMTPERVELVKKWLTEEKEALEKIGDGEGNAGERYFPTILYKDVDQKIMDMDDLITEVHSMLTGVDSLMATTEHDAITIAPELLMGIIDVTSEDYQNAVQGTPAEGIEGFGKDPGFAGGFQTFNTSPFSFSSAINAGWEMIHPVFSGITARGVAAFMALRNEAEKSGSISSISEVMSLNTYFDGSFNAIHQKAALLLTYTSEAGEFNKDDFIVDIGKEDSLDTWFRKVNGKLRELSENQLGVDYYVKVTRDVMLALSTEAFEGGANSERAIRVIDYLKSIEALPENFGASNFKTILSIDNLKSIDEEGGEVIKGLRKVFKKSVMINLYGAGREKIQAAFLNSLIDPDKGADALSKVDDMSAAEDAAEALAGISLGYGLKERQIAMTALAEVVEVIDNPENLKPTERKILEDLIGKREDMQKIIASMKKRMEDEGFSKTKMQRMLKNQMGFLSLTKSDINMNAPAFQLQAANAIIEDILRVRLGLNPDTEPQRYNAAKKRLLAKQKIARDEFTRLLRDRIVKGISQIKAENPALLKGFEDEAALVNQIVEIVTSKEPVPNVDPRLVKIGQELRGEINKPITDEQFTAVQEKMAEASGFDPAQIRALQLLNMAGRRRDPAQTLALGDMTDGENVFDAEILDNIARHVTFRGLGPDLAAGRAVLFAHAGTYHAPAGAKTFGIAKGEEDIAFGSMKIKDPLREAGLTQEGVSADDTRAYVEAMFARHMLERLSRYKFDINSPLEQIAREEGADDVALILKRNRTEDEEIQLRAEYLAAWHKAYMKAKQFENEGHIGPSVEDGDLNGINAVRARISSLMGNREGLDPEETEEPLSIEDFMKLRVKVVQDMGDFALLPQFYSVSFGNLGIPELKKISIQNKLRKVAPVSSRINDLQEFRKEFDRKLKKGIETQGASQATDNNFDMITPSQLDDLRETTYSTDPDDMMDDISEVATLPSIGISGLNDTNSSLQHSYRLERELVRFAVDKNMVNLVKKGQWQTLLFYYRAHKINLRENDRLKLTLQRIDAEREVLGLSSEEIDDRKSRAIHESRLSAERSIADLWKRTTDNADAESYTTEMAPSGNVGILRRNIFRTEDNQPQTISRILRSLGTPQNNLGTFGVIKVVAFQPANDVSSDANIIRGETRLIPLTAHNHDIQHIIKSVLAYNGFKRYLLETAEGKALTKEMKKRAAREDMSDRDFIMQVENFAVEQDIVTYDEFLQVLTSVVNNPEYGAESNISARELILGNVAESSDTIENLLANDRFDYTLNFGSGIIRVESKVRGSSSRFYLTIAQARQALVAARNSGIIETTQLAFLANIDKINRPRTMSSFLNAVDPTSNRSVRDMRLRDELDAEALLHIERRHHRMRTGESLERTNIKTVVGGREKSSLARASHGTRSLPKITNKNPSFPIFLDNEDLGKKAGQRQLQYRAELSAFLQLLKKLGLMNPTPKVDVDQLKELGFNRQTNVLLFEAEESLQNNVEQEYQRAVVLGFILSSGGTAQDVGAAYMRFFPKNRESLNKTINNKDVKKTIKIAKELIKLQTMSNKGQLNPFADDARGFVFNLIDNPASDLTDNRGILEEFVAYQASIGKEVDLSNEQESALIQAALETAFNDVYSETTLFTQNRGNGSTVRAEIPNVLATLDKSSGSALIKQKVDEAAENGFISKETAKIIKVVLAKMAAINPTFLNNIELNFGADNSMAISTPGNTLADDRYLIELSKSDLKKDPLSAAKVFIHEVVHIGAMKYLNSEQGGQDLYEMTELMRNKAVNRFAFRMTKVLHGPRGGMTALERHRRYMANPHEFFAETAAYYWMSEATEEIDAILEEAQIEKVEAALEDTKDKKAVASFASKMSNLMGRIIQMSRNAILDIRAIMKQYEDDSGFKEEFDKLKYLSQKAIGFDSTIGSVQTQARKLDDSYTRYHEGEDGADDPLPPKILTDSQLKTTLQKESQLATEIAVLSNQLAENPEDNAIDAELETKIALREEMKIVIEFNEGEADQFGANRIDRLLVELDLENKARTHGDSKVKEINFRDAVADDSIPNNILASIVITRLQNHLGHTIESFMDRQRGLSGFALNPAQTDMTMDSKFSLIRLLSLVVDAEAILTTHVLVGDKVADLQKAQNATKNDFARLRGAISRLPSADAMVNVMRFVANPIETEAATNEDEMAAIPIAQELRAMFGRVIDIAKMNGILYDGLEYSPIPIKLSRNRLNDSRVHKAISDHIGERIAGTTNIDPLTLAMSGLLPNLILPHGSRKIQDINNIDAIANFRQQLIKLRNNKEGGMEVLKMLRNLSLDGSNDYLSRLDFDDLETWTSLDILELQNGLYTIYRDGFNTQSIKDNDVIKNFVNGSRNRLVYDAASTDKLNTEQRRQLNNLKLYTEFGLGKILPVVRTDSETPKSHDSVADIRADMFLGEVGRGARFLAVDRYFDPDPAFLIESTLDSDHALNGAFEVDPAESIIPAVTTGLGFDANAATALKDIMKEDGKLGITGLSFDGLLDVVDDTLQRADLHPNVSTKGARDIYELRDHLNILRQKYDTLAGRAKRVNATEAGSIPNRLASIGKDLVLALYGGNLTVATASVEGLLSGLTMMGRGDMVMGPARLFVSIFKGAVAGGASGFSKGLKSATGINLGDPLAIRQTATELAYAHEHAMIQGVERESESDSLVSDTILDKFAKAVGVLADISTSSALGVQNNIKFQLEGLAIRTLEQLIRSGALKRLTNAFNSPEGKALLNEDIENMGTPDMRKKLKQIMNLAGINDFNFLGSNAVKIVFGLKASGLLDPEFAGNLNDLIKKAGLTAIDFDSGSKKYDAKESALSHIALLEQAALAETDKHLREQYFTVLNNLKDFVNKELESRFVGGKVLLQDTTNSAYSVLAKLFKSYPTQFFGQRIRRDSRFYGPVQNTIRMINLVAADIGYMVLMEIAKSGFDEERLDMMLEELQQKEAVLRLVSRSPVFGLWGGIMSSIVAESFIQLTTGKGYTGNILNQAFIPVPLQKAQSLFSNLLKVVRYGVFDDSEDAAGRRDLAAYQLLSSIPLLQEYFVRAALAQYLPAEASRVMTENMQRRSFGDKDKKKPSNSYYGPFSSERPFDTSTSVARNIPPHLLTSYDMLSVLANEPLTNLMGQAQEVLQPQQPQEVPSVPEQPASPQRAPEAPQMETGLPSAAGDNPSERLAEVL